MQPVSQSRLGSSSFYEVQPEDTLDTIAKRFHLSVDVLVAANGLTKTARAPVGAQLQVNGF